MPTAIETTTEIQDKVFAGIQSGQNAVVESVRTWAEAVETTFAKLPELAVATPAQPSEVLDNAFGFTERVLSSQREFLNQVFEAARPATQAAAASARSASAQSGKGAGSKS